MNPSQADIKEMEREVDPHGQRSFDQMALISLIARRPRQIHNIEEIKEAIKVLAMDEADDAKQILKISTETIKYFITAYGEKMTE